MAGSFVNFVKNVERLGQKKRGRRPVFNAHQFYPSAIEADLQRATREEFLRALEENIQLALRGFTDDIDDLTKASAELPPEFVKKVSSLADAVGVKNGWNFGEYAKMKTRFSKPGRRTSSSSASARRATPRRTFPASPPRRR